MWNPFKKKEKKKQVAIVAIHGFGKRRTDELKHLITIFQNEEIIFPELFNTSNENDTNMEDWINRAEDVVVRLLAQQKEVVVIGFSMGGVIASKIAADFPIKKLILLAPAYTYFTLNNAISTISKVVGQEKTENNHYTPLPSTFTKTFMNVVDTYKDKISEIHCPTLIIHGTEDEVIPASSSEKALAKFPDKNARLVYLAETKHRILDNEKTGPIAAQLIQDFIDEKII